jgi:hypothetical protein
MVARTWGGGAPAEASARGDIARTLARAAAPAVTPRDPFTVAAEAAAARVAEAADAPRRFALERQRLRAAADRAEALTRAASKGRTRDG